MIADSPDEVRLRVREQLMQGASQIKLTAGGGVASPFSPLDVSTFTEAELRAAVEAAENWGTYVAVHAYTPASIQRSIAAGRQGHRARPSDGRGDRPADGREGHLAEHAAVPRHWRGAAACRPHEQAKMRQVVAGTDTVYALAKKYKIKTAFGTDILFSQALAERQGNGSST